MREIRFDDLEALRAEISDEFGTWGAPVRVTQEMVDRFAEITGDHQWIHVDVERAEKESPFGGPIVHGFLTLSLVPALQVPSSFEVVGFGNATNYGADRLRFLSPVPCGSEVRARGRLVEVHVRAVGTLMKRDIEVGVVGQERPALVYRGLTLLQAPT